ncbi:MAG: hypothetical protein Q8K82_10705 [Gemmatimonadaceae bacterium]|nr:hypothetical protein [Gemmatimonadaceae bacterium]
MPPASVGRTAFAAIRIARDEFHGEWNYVISPSPIEVMLLFYASLPAIVVETKADKQHLLGAAVTSGIFTSLGGATGRLASATGGPQ